jgi:hypothetical protein
MVMRLAMLACAVHRDYTWTEEISSLSIHFGSTLEQSSPLTLPYPVIRDCQRVRPCGWGWMFVGFCGVFTCMDEWGFGEVTHSRWVRTIAWRSPCLVARRDICSARALPQRRTSGSDPTIPTRRSARRCVLGSVPVNAVTDMASEEESDETKTEDDYTPGKLLNIVCSWTL